MRLLILLAVCLFAVVNATNFKSERDIADHIFKYAKRTQTEKDVEEFNKIVKVLSFPSFVFRKSLSDYRKGRQSVACLGCRSVINTTIKMYNEGATVEELVDILSDLCTLLGIQPGHVCRGAVELNAPIFTYLIQNQPLFTAEAFCAVVFQTEDPNSCINPDDRYEWTIDVPQKKNTIEKKLTPRADDDTFQLAHITDIHYDPGYEAGALADCDEPICCRQNQQKHRGSKHQRYLEDNFVQEDRVYVDENGVIHVDIDYADEIKETDNKMEINEEEDSKAGYWGDYRDCDVPWWSFVDGVEHIAENHNIDYVYYTGDTIDHAVWSTSYEMITTSLNDTLNQLKTTFKDTPVYVAIGNHESQPLNQYAPPSVTDAEVSTAWLYDLLADKLSIWLPNDTKDTIKIGGYYTVLVKPGFRVIVLNSNLCYVYNWWIHLDPNDPSGQLKWLVDTLVKAENDGEKVHILSHIPNGITDTYKTCSREYKKIIERFSDIIMAEFNGHTHNDEFQVFYKKNDRTKPVHVAWNGGSLTPYSYVNPNYRIIDVNSTSLDVIDIHTWHYNLTEANLFPERRPNWQKEYSFREFYNVPSLEPAEIDKLINRMVTTEKELLTLHYHIFRGKSGDSWYSGCDDKCVRKNICYLTTSEVHDIAKCEELWESFNQSPSNV